MKKQKVRTAKVIQYEMGLLRLRIKRIEQFNMIDESVKSKVISAYHKAIGNLVTELNPNF